MSTMSSLISSAIFLCMPCFPLLFKLNKLFSPRFLWLYFYCQSVFKNHFANLNRKIVYGKRVFEFFSAVASSLNVSINRTYFWQTYKIIKFLCESIKVSSLVIVNFRGELLSTVRPFYTPRNYFISLTPAPNFLTCFFHFL